MTGKELSEWRKKRKLSQTDLANLSGVHKSTICRFEKSDQCGRKNYQKLMDATNFDKVVNNDAIPLREKVSLYIKEIQVLLESEETE